MKKDRRTKAELLDALDAAHERRRQAEDAATTMEHELRQAKNGKKSAEDKAATLKQSLITIRHTIKTAVAMKYPKTIAFGGIAEAWFGGENIHPGYEGDNEEVRLLRLIDDGCQEALA
jgi:hypothetical protein